MANLIKKIYNWLVYDLLWDLCHSAKWDFVFHLIIIILQLITLGILIRIYDLLLRGIVR
jgi:hypothetical protein